MRHLRPAHAPKVRTRRKLDVEALTQDKELAKRYSIAVSNSFAALADLPEASWSVVRTTILTAAQGTIPVTCGKNRPWRTPDTLSFFDKKREARLSGSVDEWRKYKGIFKARSKADLEEYYTSLAEEAEEGIERNNLRSVFPIIKKLRVSPAQHHSNGDNSVPVTRSDGQPCRSVDETLECWRSRYDNMLNHAAARPCPELTTASTSATPDPNISDDAPTIGEIRRAIKKLHNSRAAGPDNI